MGQMTDRWGNLRLAAVYHRGRFRYCLNHRRQRSRQEDSAFAFFIVK